ncbi:benenodin family lasso peptide [Novosphingobium sp. NBM11]|nr:benenodin family lasso peptide [Novosphingobium sp. NBM11]MBF5089114.1 benenodin family lasso peptide [Novosphingobium sp. NBM11]
MERVEEQRDDEVIDLGSVTRETKGPIAPLGDTVGLSFGAGLSED